MQIELEALRRDASSSTVARALLDRVADGAELSVDGALDLLEAMLPAYGALLRGEYEIRAPSLPARKDDHRYLGNPLNAPLPRAKNLQVYCLYGYNKPTPAGLRLAWAPPRPEGGDVPERYLEISKSGGGVVQGDGDGTVPLASLGYHCASGWGGSRLNPSKVRVRLKEYEHEAASLTEHEEMKPEITALLVSYKSAFGAVRIPSMINRQTNMQAAVPAIETARLLSLLGVGIDGAQLFAWLLAATGGLSIFVALLAAASARDGACDVSSNKSAGSFRISSTD